MVLECDSLMFDSDPRLQYVSLDFWPIFAPTASKSASSRVYPARNPKNYHRTTGELLTGFVRQASIWTSYHAFAFLKQEGLETAQFIVLRSSKFEIEKCRHIIDTATRR